MYVESTSVFGQFISLTDEELLAQYADGTDLGDSTLTTFDEDVVPTDGDLQVALMNMSYTDPDPCFIDDRPPEDEWDIGYKECEVTPIVSSEDAVDVQPVECSEVNEAYYTPAFQGKTSVIPNSPNRFTKVSFFEKHYCGALEEGYTPPADKALERGALCPKGQPAWIFHAPGHNNRKARTTIRRMTARI